MNAAVLRLIGITFLIAAVVAGILNLHRVADLGMPWLAPLLMVWGLACVLYAKKGKR